MGLGIPRAASCPPTMIIYTEERSKRSLADGSMKIRRGTSVYHSWQNASLNSQPVLEKGDCYTECIGYKI